jgi:DNA-binding NtrC family response regulator
MPCNVLVVEDEALSRRNIALYLECARHKVFQAETGEAAMLLMSHVIFDTVISDLRLPGAVNGIEVLKHQNLLAPGNRLVLITAFGSDEVQSEAKALGALYMEKPLLLRELLSSIESNH